MHQINNAGRLERRIEDQQDQIGRQLSGKVPHIKDYYWEESHKSTACGLSAPPVEGRSILSQLLLTPRLIVDILPPPSEQFVKVYGVRPSQMHALAEAGYVVPNIYHFRNSGWRDYLPYTPIVDILSKYGRPNTLWITAYLEKAYGFSKVEEANINFFKSVPVSPADQEAILQACHGRINQWERFAPVYGQRLAYIEVLGGKELAGVVHWIRNEYKNGRQREKAIQVLSASKSLIATEVTAAFGGTPTDVEEALQDVRESIDVLKDLLPQSAFRKLKERPPGGYEFAAELVERARKLRLPSFHNRNAPTTEALSKSAFRTYKNVLNSVADGRLGRLIDDMTAALTKPEVPLAPIIDEYRKLAAELDSRLHALAPVAAGLNKLGSWCLKVNEMNPPDDNLISWWLMIGNTMWFAAAVLHNVELAPILRRGVPRHLYADWRAVKRALGVSVSSKGRTT